MKNAKRLLLGMVSVTVAAFIVGTYAAIVGKVLVVWCSFLWNLY